MSQAIISFSPLLHAVTVVFDCCIVKSSFTNATLASDIYIPKVVHSYVIGNVSEISGHTVSFNPLFLADAIVLYGGIVRTVVTADTHTGDINVS